MGNEVAYFVLVMWPLIAIYLFRTKTIQVATLWTLMGGFMLLPVKTVIDLPLIPPLGKNSIPVLAVLMGCWFIKQKKFTVFANTGFLKILVFLYFVAPIITVELNGDVLNIAGRYFPGLTLHDTFSILIGQFLYIAPFFIGWQFFRTYEHQLLMFKTLVLAGLFYSLLMLFEVRMSPQLHIWIYGYFPHSFGQQYRFGGFRPVVFMGHGLLVSFFAAIVLVAAAALWRNKTKITHFSPAWVNNYLLMILVLCKSVASLIYGVFGFLMVMLASSKAQLRIAVILVCLTLFYPMMSIMKVFPHQQLIELVKSIDPARAGSLQFRFNNEDLLLTHARKRFFFGWGGWERNRVFNEETGKDESITDGRWIITFGVFGFFGFLAEFGLLAIVVFKARKASKLITSNKELILLAAHAMILSLIMIDQLPNASLAPWLWLLAGILLGRSEDILMQNKAKFSFDSKR